MTVRLFRMSGLPALPQDFAAFKKEWAEGYDKLNSTMGKFISLSDEDKIEYPKMLNALEDELYLKYPRENKIEIETGEDLARLVTELGGALSFCYEDIQGEPTQLLTCYILDHG